MNTCGGYVPTGKVRILSPVDELAEQLENEKAGEVAEYHRAKGNEDGC
jgi:hypothetical protein